MSVKVGQVDPLELIPAEALDATHSDKRITIYASSAGVELVAVPCVLSVSDVDCLISLLQLAKRRAMGLDIDMREGKGQA